MATPLRAVKANERTARKKMASVSEAVESGDELDVLYAQRDRIAKAMSDDRCSPRDLAPLSRQLNAVQKEIKVLEDAAAAATEAESRSGEVDNTFRTEAV